MTDELHSDQADAGAPMVSNPFLEWAEAFSKKVAEDARACLGKRAAELTNRERFCVAVCAGVRITGGETKPGGTINFVTEPCAVVDDGKGGFVVCMMARGRGDARTVPRQDHDGPKGCARLRSNEGQGWSHGSGPQGERDEVSAHRIPDVQGIHQGASGQRAKAWPTGVPLGWRPA